MLPEVAVPDARHAAARHVELHRAHVVAREREVAEGAERRQAARILGPQLQAEHLLLQFELPQVAVLPEVGGQAVGAGKHLAAQGVQLARRLDLDLLGNREVHLEQEFRQADRGFGLQDRRAQVAQLHLGREQVVLRGQAVVVLQLRILDRAAHRGLRFVQHGERLLGQQDVVEGLFDLGDQVDARRARRLDGRGHLCGVEPQHAVDLRGEERQRGVHRTAYGRVGVVAEREALRHLLHDEVVVELPAHRDLRQQGAPRLALDVVVALDLHLRHADRGVLAQGQPERVVERQPQLRPGGECAEQQQKSQDRSFHDGGWLFILSCCGRGRSVSGSRPRAPVPWPSRCRGRSC